MGSMDPTTYMCWDLRFDKLSKVLAKTMIATEDVESKQSTKLKHQEYMFLSSSIQ